jgi:hypothetical protein
MRLTTQTRLIVMDEQNLGHSCTNSCTSRRFSIAQYGERPADATDKDFGSRCCRLSPRAPLTQFAEQVTLKHANYLACGNRLPNTLPLIPGFQSRCIF